MTVTLDKSHELKGNGYLLGVGGENESEQLIINIAYDVLLDKWAYIEFEQIGAKHTTERLTIANGQIVYSIPNGLLVAGHTSVQVVFRDASGFVWKSFKRQFLVSDEINATDNYPQSYPDFITEAQRLLDEITVESDKVDEVLATEEARVAAEAKRAESEATRIENETERETTEAERKAAETARITAENERQINEAGRVAAETARRTEFSGWANSLGNLNTYDKRLINLEEAGVGTLFDYVTDDTEAFIKSVPAKALPYARLNSVGVVTSIKSVGKNLIDIAQGFIGSVFIIAENGECVLTKASETNRLSAKIPLYIQQGKAFVVSFEMIENTMVVDGFSGIKAEVFFIDGTTKTYILENGRKITCDKATSAIRLCADKSEAVGAYTKFKHLQIEYGTTATAYEPYRATTYTMPLTDNYIKVEPNGTVVFENDAAAAVPSEIIYAVKR